MTSCAHRACLDLCPTRPTVQNQSLRCICWPDEVRTPHKPSREACLRRWRLRVALVFGANMAIGMRGTITKHVHVSELMRSKEAYKCFRKLISVRRDKWWASEWLLGSIQSRSPNGHVMSSLNGFLFRDRQEFVTMARLSWNAPIVYGAAAR